MDLNFSRFDLDVPFASCETLSNPRLKHVLTVVGGKSQRGAITTVNYETGKYGLHSAVSIFQVKKVVPNLVIVAPDLEKYRRNNERAFKVLSSLSNKTQKMGIDGDCMDISRTKMDRLELASLIRENVKVRTELSISIGVSYGMSLARLASDWNKPREIRIITQDGIPNILLNLKVGKIQGIGRKSEEKLNKIGIREISDLYDLSRDNLRGLLGKFGEAIYDKIRGINERQLDLSRIRKSIGVEYTLEHDLKSYNGLLKKAGGFSEELSNDLHKKNIKAETTRIKIKLNDFSVITKSITLEEYISDSSDIFRIAKYLVVNTKIEKSVRLLGITVTNLSDTTFGQLKFL